MAKRKMGHVPFPPKYDPNNYPIKIGKKACLYREQDLIQFLPLMMMLKKETGWSDREIMEWMITDDFPESYPCFTPDLKADFAWIRKDVENYLEKWRKERKEHARNLH